jgi:uncharacterized Zn finger protein
MAKASEPDRAGTGHDVYRCENCGVVFSEAEAVRSPDTDRALVLNFGVDSVRH